ncbi:hypothetical protein ACFE04_003343 [Oxalis oulophora]
MRCKKGNGKGHKSKSKICPKNIKNSSPPVVTSKKGTKKTIATTCEKGGPINYAHTRSNVPRSFARSAAVPRSSARSENPTTFIRSLVPQEWKFCTITLLLLFGLLLILHEWHLS